MKKPKCWYLKKEILQFQMCFGHMTRRRVWPLYLKQNKRVTFETANTNINNIMTLMMSSRSDFTVSLLKKKKEAVENFDSVSKIWEENGKAQYWRLIVSQNNELFQSKTFRWAFKDQFQANFSWSDPFLSQESEPLFAQQVPLFKRSGYRFYTLVK